MKWPRSRRSGSMVCTKATGWGSNSIEGGT
jgi:hypothetical protein